MAAEIADQPRAWRALLAERSSVAEVGAAVAARRPRFVQFVARGTSGHAALYAKYLVEIRLGLPCGLASPSTVTVYDGVPSGTDVLCIGVSQSGGSPDLVATLDAARRAGALTVAVTNDPTSPLAAAAEFQVDVHAGPERSVAATKTYTAEMLALYLLVAAWEGTDSAAADVLPDLGDRVLGDSAPGELAQRYRFAQRLIATGRGYSYATAREAALKLMETSYVTAQGFSAADLMHGPLATIDAQVPVLAVLPAGRGGEVMAPVLRSLAERGADVVGVGDPERLTGLAGGVALPEGASEELSPLLEIVPLQRLALQLALDRGEDPDTPRGLRKVTETL
ncbi:SIS domain-containing protein [Gordonia shandongensis]|uniref:SIS domain-containing protein n=1 Tax=Gordonia shandongensis TaxID=376351 RepID=UPI000688CDAA|nr:SIS domain-containing protein [Gordonia shandongensis]